MSNGTNLKHSGDNTYTFAGFFLLSLIFAFNILLNSPACAAYGDNITQYLVSACFLAWLAALSAGFFILFVVLHRVLKIVPGPDAGRKMFLVIAGLFLTGFLLSFVKNSNRGCGAFFNSVPVLSMVVLYLWLKTFQAEKKEGDVRVFGLIIAAAGAFILFAFIANILNYNNYSTFSKDFGVFANALWRMGHDGSQFTIIEDMQDHRAVHFQPVMYLLAMVYKVVCTPYVLIFFQVFFPLGAAVYLYLLAKRLVRSNEAALFLSLSYLVSTYTARTFMYDYHPESMYMMMFFAFIYYAEVKKFLLSALFMCLAVAVKEEAAIYTGLASVFLYLVHKDKKYLAASAAAFIYAFLIIGVIMPQYKPQGGGWAVSLMHNLFSPKTTTYYYDYVVQLVVFFVSVLLLPFFRPAAIILLVLPPVFVHTMNYGGTSNILFNLWYSSFTAPPLFAASLYALNKISGQKNVFSNNIVLLAFGVFLMQLQIHLSFMSLPALYITVGMVVFTAGLISASFLWAKAPAFPKLVLFAAAALAVFYSGFCLYQASKMGNIPDEAKKSIDAAIKYIPADVNAPVIANSNVVTHLCSRKYIWAFDESSAGDAFNPVIKEGFSGFYLLIYLNDFTYSSNHVDPDKRNNELADLADKYGYAYHFVYNDNITGLLEFDRK